MNARAIDVLAGRALPPPWAHLPLAVLRAAGVLYGVGQAARAGAYRYGLVKTYRAPCPVISVGNVVSGGTGKTPMVLWLAERLQELGRRVAVVSRGYRQAAEAPVTVVADLEGVRMRPPGAADEACLVAERLPGVAVLTGRDRRRLIDHAVQGFGCDTILMDDGFQHLRVARDLDLCLLDAARPFGNGAVLPGGILRESPRALRRAHLAVLTRADTPRHTELATDEIHRVAPGVPVVVTRHAPRDLLRLADPETLPLDGLGGIRTLGFSGIARPDSFRRLLERQQVRLAGWFVFPDHHEFTAGDFLAMEEEAKVVCAECLVCTEKDAVKIDPTWSPLPIYVLRMELGIDEGEDLLLQHLHRVISREGEK
ncbi:MAG: tetraacyldisaccharide 4'-kinase [Nitrospirota bacterium]